MKMALKKRILIALTLCLMLNVSAAKEEWKYEESIDTPRDKPFYMLMKMKLNAHGLGLFCRSDLSVIVFIMEHTGFDEPAIELLNTRDLKLRITIDDNETIAIPTEFGINRSLTLLSATSLAHFDLIQQIMNAKSRITVALDIVTEIRYEETFSVPGLSESVNQFFKGCWSFKHNRPVWSQ